MILKRLSKHTLVYSMLNPKEKDGLWSASPHLNSQVLKERNVQLMYLTLSLLPTTNSSYTYSYLIYQNPKYEAESPPDLEEFQDRQQDSYGRLTFCGSVFGSVFHPSGVCDVGNF